MLKIPADYAATVLIDHCNQDWRDVLPSIGIFILIATPQANRTKYFSMNQAFTLAKNFLKELKK